MWPLLLAGAGAYLGSKNAEYQRNQENKNMQANAAAMQYSPWTGMKPEMMQTKQTNPFLQTLQGGLMGGMQGMGISKYFADQKAAEEAAKAATQSPAATAQYSTGQNLPTHSSEMSMPAIGSDYRMQQPTFYR